MCCLFVVLLTLGPRVGGILWWIFDPTRWNLAFDSIIWPILGIIFLPWTTLFYLLVFPGGVTGIDWLWIVIGVLGDAASYAGGGWRRRDVPYYPDTMP